jgi:hypothetical protein
MTRSSGTPRSRDLVAWQKHVDGPNDAVVRRHVLPRDRVQLRLSMVGAGVTSKQLCEMRRDNHSVDPEGIHVPERAVLEHNLATPEAPMNVPHFWMSDPDYPVIRSHLGVAK